MKRFLLCLFTLLAQYLGISQNPYYDALNLTDLRYRASTQIQFATGQDKEIFEICKKYSTASDYPSLQKEFIGNPFISFPKNDGSSIALANTTPSKEISGSIGGLNITTIADGLAKFLVQRTKQELSIAFFDDFKDKIDEIPELKIMFPNTKRVLDAIGEEIYQYPAYINSLKEAFELDLDNILVTLDTYITQEHGDKKHIVEPISGTLYFANHLKNGEHPAEAASKLAKRDDPAFIDTDDYRKFIYALRILDIFSQSLRSKEEEKYWISRDELNKLTSNDIALNIYLGLLYQKHKDDKTFPTAVGNSVGAYLLSIKDKVEQIKEPIQSFVGSAEVLGATVKSLKESKSKGENIDSYFSLINNSLTTIGKADDLAEKLGIPANELKEFDSYLYILNLVNSITADVKEKKYNSAVINLVALSDTLNIAEEVFKKDFLKYGTFIANVAQAENSDQVQAAIEAIALPVGSASIKKKTEFNIALNSYVGLSPGIELNQATDEWKGIFGLHTPVGIAFSWGKEKICTSKKGKTTVTKKRNISNSIFISAIDISAFSTFRFNDNETEELPEVSLSNIFAPGLYYVRGFNKVPISWGIGGQLGPQLREVTPMAVNTTDGLNFSFRTFISVDIPLLNFYTKSR